VARQRLQDHSLQSSGTKPDLKPSQVASCRQQKTLAPAPPEPQCSAADIVPAPAPPSLSAMGEFEHFCVFFKSQCKLFQNGVILGLIIYVKDDGCFSRCVLSPTEDSVLRVDYIIVCVMV
jgi:hypothetical protein